MKTLKYNTVRQVRKDQIIDTVLLSRKQKQYIKQTLQQNSNETNYVYRSLNHKSVHQYHHRTTIDPYSNTSTLMPTLSHQSAKRNHSKTQLTHYSNGPFHLPRTVLAPAQLVVTSKQLKTLNKKQRESPKKVSVKNQLEVLTLNPFYLKNNNNNHYIYKETFYHEDINSTLNPKKVYENSMKSSRKLEEYLASSTITRKKNANTQRVTVHSSLNQNDSVSEEGIRNTIGGNETSNSIVHISNLIQEPEYYTLRPLKHRKVVSNMEERDFDESSHEIYRKISNPSNYDNLRPWTNHGVGEEVLNSN